MTIPQIFDEALRARRRAKATAPFFLNAEFEDALLDRLQDVTREFERGEGRGEIREALSSKLKSHPKVGQMVLSPHFSPPSAPLQDLILSFWELGAINDVPGYLSQIRQSLKPDGWFLGVFYGGETLIELRHVLWQADEEILGGVSQRVAPMIDLRDAAGLLQRAGFALPVADYETVTLHYPNLFVLMRDLRAAGLSNVLHGRHSYMTPKKYFMRAAEIYAQQYGTPDGKIRATAEVIHLSAWAPGATQQKPMIPGTATQRLADALNATEYKV